MSRRATGVNDPFGNTLMIEVRDLFTKMKILEQSRPAFSALERVRIVVEDEALIGRKTGPVRVRRHPREGVDFGVAILLALALDWSGFFHGMNGFLRGAT